MAVAWVVCWGRLDGGFRAGGPGGEVNARPQRAVAVHFLVLCLREWAEQILPSSGWEHGKGIVPATGTVVVRLLNGSVTWTPLLAFTVGLKLMF